MKYPHQYTLGQLIARLKKADPDHVCPLGFHHPHSYRGSYQDCAFEPADNVSVGDMLQSAEEALGATFSGYKSGAYTMHADTLVWLAERGDEGETLGAILLEYMLNEKPDMASRRKQRKRKK